MITSSRAFWCRHSTIARILCAILQVLCATTLGIAHIVRWLKNTVGDGTSYGFGGNAPVNHAHGLDFLHQGCEDNKAISSKKSGWILKVNALVIHKPGRGWEAFSPSLLFRLDQCGCHGSGIPPQGPMNQPHGLTYLRSTIFWTTYERSEPWNHETRNHQMQLSVCRAAALNQRALHLQKVQQTGRHHAPYFKASSVALSLHGVQFGVSASATPLRSKETSALGGQLLDLQAGSGEGFT